MKKLTFIIFFMSYIIQSAFGGAKIPKAVMDSINENAINYPKDVRASWKENQIDHI